ncbi:NAD(P)/FAD-dependent oxidoreductase [Actinokineospora soli]|uniref:NAD(P)/FAD-dependent oxidoreductase n=1 Tax=Actinokineospora soli TaxID=1048753 RepID=A0ABW2TSZ2_9PSEU
MKAVVVGGGYAGVHAANRLARLVPTAEITLVNPRPHFVERVRLHQRVAGTAAAAAPLREVLRPGITALVAAVDKIGDGVAVLDDGARVDFDHAFLAVGSTVEPMPGTVPVGTWEGAERARAALAALPAGASVTVIGGGPTGIETASEVAQARPDLRVRLVGSPIAGPFGPGARARVLAGLERLGVDLVEDTAIAVDDAVRLGSGRAFSSHLTLWAVIGHVPDLAARSGLAVDPDGRVVVDEHLRSVSDPRVFAVGDCAAVPGSRFSCQTAVPQAATAVDNLVRLLEGRTPRPHVVRYVGLAVALGRRDAVVQLNHRDDRPRRARLAGRAAAAVKEIACRGAKWGASKGIGG